MASPPGAPRLVITSNDSEGKSVISVDHEMKLFTPFGPNTSQFATLYTTDSMPANNTAPLPPQETTSIPRPSANGTVLCTSDVPPKYTSAVHRTATLDYMVVLKGKIVLRVDEGKEVTIKEGEIAINRGNMHAWVNKSDQWCRLLFVMMPAEKVVLQGGKVLEDAFTPHKQGV